MRVCCDIYDSKDGLLPVDMRVLNNVNQHAHVYNYCHILLGGN